jgi:DNA-binding HxlR family transcriptional regulator
MEWRDVETTYCGVASTLDIVGDRWSWLILRDIFAGTRRYDALHRHIGVSTAVLADRLKKLEDGGILDKVSYQEPGQRRRYEYRLTERGIDLAVTQMAMAEFGYHHLVDEENRLVRYHTRDGRPVTVKMVTDDGEIVEPRDVVLEVDGDRLKR